MGSNDLFLLNSVSYDFLLLYYLKVLAIPRKEHIHGRLIEDESIVCAKGIRGGIIGFLSFQQIHLLQLQN